MIPVAYTTARVADRRSAGLTESVRSVDLVGEGTTGPQVLAGAPGRRDSREHRGRVHVASWEVLVVAVASNRVRRLVHLQVAPIRRPQAHTAAKGPLASAPSRRSAHPSLTAAPAE